MSQWTDIATWIGPTPNRNPHGMGDVWGLCLHVDQGTEAGSEAWERNPQAEVSSHFMAPKVGLLRQMVDTADLAWAQAGGNPNYLSVECEGDSGQQLTVDQVHNLAVLCARIHVVHNMPLVLANVPGQHGLIYHAAGGTEWGDHPDCPGAPIIAARPSILSAAAALLGGDPVMAMHPYPGFLIVQGMNGPFVKLMQQALIRDGFSCGPAGADGVFGPYTALALGRFQKTHPQCRSIRSDGTPDEMCGPATWSVLRP